MSLLRLRLLPCCCSVSLPGGPGLDRPRQTTCALRPSPPAGVAALRELLLDSLWRCFLGPVLFWPLIQEDVAAQHIAALSVGSAGVENSGATAGGSRRGGRAA